MRKENKALMTLVTTALLTAITLLCTLIIKIPIGVGYIHLGDAIVLLGVIMLPRKYACFSGAVGATLADIIGGFAAWAPWTFFIQILIVLTFGAFLDMVRKRSKGATSYDAKFESQSGAASAASDAGKKASTGSASKKSALPIIELLGYVIASLVCIVGYYLAESIMYGNWIAPMAGVPFNILQMLVGAVVAVLVSNALEHTAIRESMYYRR